jgi:hypothetical protein
MPKPALNSSLALVILAPFILLITTAFTWTAPAPDPANIQLPPAAFPPGDVPAAPPVTNGNSDRATDQGGLWLADVPQPKIGPRSFCSVVTAPVEIPEPQQPTTAVTLEEFTTADLPGDPTMPLGAADIEHVVIISMDGVRPDAIDEADTPNLDKLIAQGAYSRHAQTIDPSFTLPSHTSMLSGVAPKKHGIVEALPCIGCRLTIGPTIFSVAQEAGLSTGMVFGKEKLNYIALPNTVDELFGVDAHDPEILDEALTVIQESMPNILFIHFPDTDRVGHEYGWMSPNYLYAVSYMDGEIGKIVDMLDSEGYLDTTLLIVLSDHGGHDFQHGLACPEDMTIPWLAVGPGVPQGVTLTSHIRIYDTAATAAYAFNLPIPERWDGRPVVEIFENQLATVAIQ